ncbi:MAG: YceI family protein [Phycisphaerales bacterium]
MRHRRIIVGALIVGAGAGMLGFAQLGKVKKIGENVVDKVENAGKEVAAHVDVPTYGVDSVHSSVIFKIKHGVSNFYGRFTDLKGEWSFDPSDASTARFAFSIPTKSVETDNARRNNHLKSGDFFNAAQFPEISFQSTSVEATSGDMYEVKGDLTMLGKTRKITAQLEWLGTADMQGKTVGAFEAHFTIDRTDYGMDFGVGMLGKNVDLIVAVEGGKN